MMVKIDSGKCTGCGKCVDACPMEVITIRKRKATVGGGCVACGACISACPHGAISL